MYTTDYGSGESHESAARETMPTAAQSFPSIDEKALLRKIDFRVIPILFIIYVAAFLDRVNISNALTMNMPSELHLVGQQRNIALTIFFVPYVLFEIPSNILLKRFSPHVWLSGCIFAFGIVMLCQGFVKSYSGLLATRFFLGLAEAGVFPGSFYILSFWYKREESQRRFTVFWCSVLAATAFGGLLASAIAKMDGIHGLSNWRWIFILEGMVTMLIAIAAFFLISDFPQEARWLTDEERKFVMARVGANEEQGGAVTSGSILAFFMDIKNIMGGIIYFAVIIPIYSFAYFAPTIIKTLGYSTVQTQLHTVPPVAAALALCLITAYASDYTRLRLPFVFLGTMLIITGLAILLTVHHTFSVQYLAICLVAMGAFSAGPIIICWYVMNLNLSGNNHAERTIGTAWIISFGNTGGIVATFSFLVKDAPKYRTGYSICMGATCAGVLAMLAYAALVSRENRAMRNAVKAREGGLGEKDVRYYSL
ncbi:hypothetical protein MMC22_008616 [Lobaria immixta]|nr:hypothetical protein [Lobaria immixta]